MSARVSKISLVVFVVMLVLSGFLLSVAGGYWPWYAVTATFAVVPIFAGPRRYRILGAIGLALSVVLIVSDISAGKQFRARREIQLRR
jgi:uncharacterized RDD family membrane protein YckC